MEGFAVRHAAFSSVLGSLGVLTLVEVAVGSDSSEFFFSSFKPSSEEAVSTVRIRVGVVVRDEVLIGLAGEVEGWVFAEKQRAERDVPGLMRESSRTSRALKYGMKKMYATARTPKKTPRMIPTILPIPNSSRDGAVGASTTINRLRMAQVIAR